MSSKRVSVHEFVLAPESDLQDFVRGKALFSHLQSRGLVLTPSADGDFLIAIDHDAKMYRNFIAEGGSSKRSVLIRLEPISVFPAQYQAAVTNLYGFIITPGSTDYQEYGTDDFIGWPYGYHANPNRPIKETILESVIKKQESDQIFSVENWIKRKEVLSMIAANKVSPTHEGNYKLRRKIAKSIPPQVLSVYGPLWNGELKNKLDHRLWVARFALANGTILNIKELYGDFFCYYKSAKGIVKNKYEVLRNSRFALVVENSDTYVSEKIFDAFISGAIPIYIGPDLEKVGFPQGISFKSNGDANEIINIVDSFSAEMAELYLGGIEDFLKSKYFWETWSEKAVWQKISNKVFDYFESVQNS